ncbi:sulfurtransferase TusA family protein [Shewanella sp. 1_MG-2023]|uniref:Sulfurtransferase TusA family protein n=1 Tax=Shewanella electrodiphila TaxID=934143 RepID=A0ABT0KQP2_9GAMM|nr:MULTISPECIES: sulfurtransferase TusA family protein [Shewanella]MCC4832879.1 sulfurtransferase TusA family protein [Shewanella sp. 10N.7]MCL1045959.1 sulfurtransferase TusA family protein [Shewanella electrodiphila]MDO6610985.1 sulfurtransferase TusA family protein [Shewanella sp. 7_MG-2023]MDO6770164.1 sulfurtransferase TusA family protein [Shewanella sp. 2_MG-2023]MDO6794724.1 sulfurtransferase TusA family protein [Shewanella sp. 1_MG-2023]
MKFIDLTAHQCPYPLVQTKLALKKMQPGETLAISISDSGSRRDVPLFLKKFGYQVQITEDNDNSMSLAITKLNNI